MSGSISWCGIIGFVSSFRVWQSFHGNLVCGQYDYFILLQISATKWGGLGLQYRLPARIFFVQTGGVVPPILYLESFCSWFLSNHAFSFCSCICWVSWSIQHKISLAFCHLTEYHLTNCTGSTLDPTKFNHWQLQNVLRIYVGRNFGWQRPNYKMSLGKIMLEIPTFSYFFDFRCIGFCSTGFELFSEPERVMFFIL